MKSVHLISLNEQPIKIFLYYIFLILLLHIYSDIYYDLLKIVSVILCNQFFKFSNICFDAHRLLTLISSIADFTIELNMHRVLYKCLNNPYIYLQIICYTIKSTNKIIVMTKRTRLKKAII